MIKKNNFIGIFTLISLICTFTLMSSTSVNAAASDSPVSGQRYFIKNVGTGKYLNVDGNSSKSGTNVSIFSKDIRYPRGQIFKLIKNGKYYMLKPDCSSCVLNVYSNQSYNGADVNIYTKSGSKTQSWVFTSVTGGYRITSMGNNSYDYSSYVLNATGSSNRSNINIENYSSISKNQVWILKKVSDKQLLVEHLNSRVGQSYEAGKCARFVWETYRDLFGYGNPGLCCAHKYGEEYKILSDLKSNIPVGATVFWHNKNVWCNTCGNYAGHIGFYVGNGYVIHASGGKIKKTTIDKAAPDYAGWGWYRKKTLN